MTPPKTGKQPNGHNGAHLRGTVPWRRGRKAEQLTTMEERFCQLYVAQYPRHNASAAALEAGYSASGVSVRATRLLKKGAIQERLRKLLAEQMKGLAKKLRARTPLTDRLLLEKDVAIVTADVRKIGRIADGVFLVEDSDLWPDEAVAAVKSVAQTEMGLKIQFHEVHPSLSRLYQHLGLRGGGDPLPPGGLTINRAIIYLPEKEPLALGAPPLPLRQPVTVRLPVKDTNGQEAAPRAAGPLDTDATDDELR